MDNDTTLFIHHDCPKIFSLYFVGDDLLEKFCILRDLSGGLQKWMVISCLLYIFRLLLNCLSNSFLPNLYEKSKQDGLVSIGSFFSSSFLFLSSTTSIVGSLSSTSLAWIFTSGSSNYFLLYKVTAFTCSLRTLPIFWEWEALAYEVIWFFIIVFWV